MKKKYATIIVTIITIILVVVKLVDVLNSDNNKNIISPSSIENGQTVLDMEFQYEVDSSSSIYKGEINKEQKINMKTPAELCCIDKASKIKKWDFIFEITDAKVSRELPDIFKTDKKYLRQNVNLSSAVLTDGREFIKDFYYLIVSVKCTLLSERAHSTTSSTLHYMFIDGENAYDNGGTYIKNNQQFNCGTYYEIESGDNNALAYDRELLKSLPTGTVCEYTACYIITDEMKEFL